MILLQLLLLFVAWATCPEAPEGGAPSAMRSINSLFYANLARHGLRGDELPAAGSGTLDPPPIIDPPVDVPLRWRVKPKMPGIVKRELSKKFSKRKAPRMKPDMSRNDRLDITARLHVFAQIEDDKSSELRIL